MPHADDEQFDKDVLAIVGSTTWPAGGLLIVRSRIETELDRKRPDEIISGGAIGVDTLAVQVARERGIPYREFLPAHRRWVPDGFKDRNIKIVNECTRLFAIRSKISRTYGSGWAADEAERRGKLFLRLIL